MCAVGLVALALTRTTATVTPTHQVEVVGQPVEQLRRTQGSRGATMAGGGVVTNQSVGSTSSVVVGRCRVSAPRAVGTTGTPEVDDPLPRPVGEPDVLRPVSPRVPPPAVFSLASGHRGCNQEGYWSL